MNRSQIQKGFDNIEYNIWLLKLNKRLSIDIFQQLGVVLSNFPNRLLFDFFSEIIIDTRNDILNLALSEEETDEINRLLIPFSEYLEMVLKGSIDENRKGYFSQTADYFFQLQPKIRRKSRHNSIRIVKSIYLYLHECIARFITTKDMYFKSRLCEQILRFYASEFDREYKYRMFITQTFSKPKLRTIKKYWQKLLTNFGV